MAQKTKTTLMWAAPEKIKRENARRAREMKGKKVESEVKEGEKEDKGKGAEDRKDWIGEGW